MSQSSHTCWFATVHWSSESSDGLPPGELPPAPSVLGDMVRGVLRKVYKNVRLPASYAVGQLERAGDTGRYHAQICFKFRARRSFAKVKAFLQDLFRKFSKGWAVPHLEATKHGPKAVDYVTKEDTRVAGPWSFGDPPAPGKRSDLASVAQLIRGGSDRRSVCESHPVVAMRYSRGIEYLYDVFAPTTRPDPITILVVGECGTGKSWWVQDRERPDELFTVWDDKYYDGICPTTTTAVKYEEFRGNIPYRNALQLWDGYPIRAATKGSSRMFRPERIYILSNLEPQHWYTGITEREPLWFRTLIRRIKCCIRVSWGSSLQSDLRGAAHIDNRVNCGFRDTVTLKTIWQGNKTPTEWEGEVRALYN